MRSLSIEQCREWAPKHGFPINPSFGYPIRHDVPERLQFTIPSDAGARVALVRALWGAAVADAPEVLLWITDWSVWPSGEYLPLAAAVRRNFGAERSLKDAPGHLVAAGEEDAGLSILLLSALFLWDCWVLPSGSNPCLFVSHDEFGIVGVRHGDRGIGKLLTEFEVMESPTQP